MTHVHRIAEIGMPRQWDLPEGRPVVASDTVRRVLVVILFASIFLQRFTIPGGNVGFNLVVTTLGVVFLLARGALIIDPARAALFCCFAACVSVSALLHPATTSIESACLILVIYLPFVVSLRTPDGLFRTCIDAFLAMTLVCAVVGVIQYFAQFVVHPNWLFTFRGVLPESMLLKGFDNIITLYWGSTIYKSNGFFFVEPSTFSQYLAVAIVFELLFRTASWRLGAYALALALSHSGTGLILLAIMLPLVLLHRRAYGAAAGLALLAAAAFTFGGFLHMDATVSRVGEFGSQESSAHARFIAGFVLESRYVLPRLGGVLFGLGPGSFGHYAHMVSFEAHDLTLVKLLFEYGLVGSCVFWVLFALSVFAGAPSGWVSTALTIGFLTFGAMVLDPRMQPLLLLFCVLPKRRRPPGLSWQPGSMPFAEAVPL
jgi:hypothetical protein